MALDPDEDAESAKGLLSFDDASSCGNDPYNEDGRRDAKPFTRSCSIWWLLCLALCSLTLNVYFIVTNLYINDTRTDHDRLPLSTLMGPSAYTGLSLNIPTTHHHHTDYWSANDTIADQLWEAIDTNPMVIALTDDFAASHGLPRSARWAWDDGKGRYFVKVFHQLHCLVSRHTNCLLTSSNHSLQKFIRRAFTDYQRGLTPTLDGHHVHHCLDSLRQDIQCIADDTLMPTGGEARSIGDQQNKMCRNFSALVEWIYDPERNACHRSLSDYRSIQHPVERYAFCQEGSEYYGVMTGYFDEHGHVDPWV